MGGHTEHKVFTMMGLCQEATDKLFRLRYIDNAFMPGDGPFVAGLYVLTPRGRKALGDLVRSIEEPEAEGA